MALSDYTDNFLVSNNEDWTGAFTLMMGGTGDAPWSGVPAWAPGAVYGAASACTFSGDLYVARTSAMASNWTSATDFMSDIDNAGASRWVLVSYAASWAQVPYNLTGCSAEFAIKPVDDFGNVTSAFAALSAVTGTDELTITNADGGGLEFAIPYGRTAGVEARLYRYDIIVTRPDGRRDRVRYGLWAVDQGIAG